MHWTVKNLILSNSLEGFFLASLTHGKTRECCDGTIVVAPLEFEALCRTRGLKVTYLPQRPTDRLLADAELPISAQAAESSSTGTVQ